MNDKRLKELIRSFLKYEKVKKDKVICNSCFEKTLTFVLEELKLKEEVK